MFEGLHKKYIIAKSDGTPVDPKADYFVLRLDTDPAARQAAYTYARAIQSELPALAAELMDRVDEYEFGQPSRETEEAWTLAEEGDRNG